MATVTVENVLLHAPGWLGDCIMAMPAVQTFRRHHPDCLLSVLTKSNLAALWRLHPDVDAVLGYDSSLTGTWRAVLQLTRPRPDRVVIFPNSFRSALIPYLARIRNRQGFAGHWRRAMLTRVVHRVDDPARVHQAWEYMALVTSERPATLPMPALRITEALKTRVQNDFELWRRRRWIAVIPGAARGPSKRWPARGFAEVAAGLLARTGADAGVLVMGAAGETELCDEVAAPLGAAAVNTAGRTTLDAFAALLSLCDVAIANDSGGMHLATAVGTPVVAVFGVTNPRQTGPLGERQRVLSAAGAAGSRHVPRDSAEARACLERIRAEQVLDAALELLGGR